MTNLELQKMANEVRKGIITGVHAAKAGHPGGSLSAADIFTYLYFEEMNIDPKDPKKADRDRFVLSKGHTAPGLYAALANRGYFPVEDLVTLRKLGSYLQGHPCMQSVPGVDMSSGSLGQGISVACGMALGAKMSGDSFRVYTLLGDGEIEEGQVWEAAMFAGHRKLDKLGKEKHQLESYQMQLRYLSPVNQIQEKRTHLMNLEEQLEHLMKQNLSSNKHRLAIYIEQLRGLSPLDKLSQGYAFVENRQGQVIHDIRQVKQEDELQIYLQNGRISAKALEIEEIDYGIERNES